MVDSVPGASVNPRNVQSNFSGSGGEEVERTGEERNFR